MISFSWNVTTDRAVAHFLSTSAGALAAAVIGSAVVGLIVWWAVALVVSFLALAPMAATTSIAARKLASS
jgi:hypothetical protein